MIVMSLMTFRNQVQSERGAVHAVKEKLAKPLLGFRIVKLPQKPYVDQELEGRGWLQAEENAEQCVVDHEQQLQV